MDYNLEINNLRNNLHKNRYYNELNYLEKMNKDEMSDVEILRIDNLKKIINELEAKENKKSKLFDEIDTYIYRKPWKNLTPFHRFYKIKEYINNQENILDKDKDKLLKELEELIFDNKLVKNSVIYNPNTEKIESIPALKFNDDKTFRIIVD